MSRKKLDLRTIVRRVRQFSSNPSHEWRHFAHLRRWRIRLARGQAEGVCFLAHLPMHYACFAPIHRFLPAVAVATLDRGTSAYLAKAGVKHVPDYPGLGYPRCVIVASSDAVKEGLIPPGVKVIQINHGLGLAKATYYAEPLVAPSDLYLVSGEMARRRLEACGVERVAPVGFPKIDRFFDGSLDRLALCHDLGIPADRPVVLYAPSRGRVCSAESVLPILPQLAAVANVLVKPHDAAPSAALRLCRETAGIKFIDDPDATPYLYLADLLISDVSSVVFEYALLNRPIILVRPPGCDWRKKVVDPDFFRVGVELENATELPRVALELLHGDRTEQRAYRAELLHMTGIKRDGQAGRRAADAIASFLQKEGIG